MRHTHDLVELLRSLGDPIRLRLLAALEQGELTVGEITRVTGLSQPRVSRHLKLLCNARVLQRTRDQNEVYYRATIDEDRRALVREALGCLPADDPEIAHDRQRLTEILAGRQARARALLNELGVRPLNAATISEVEAAVEKVLERRLPDTAPDDAPLGDLLDVGTGTGSMLRLLSPRAKRTVAVDRSREMRLVARARVSFEGLTNCTVQDGDMYSLSFPQESFDIVTMDRVLGTADRPEDAVKQAALVLKNDGHLLIIETQGSPVNEEKIDAWVKQAGLTPVEVNHGNRGTAMVALATRSAPA